MRFSHLFESYALRTEKALDFGFRFQGETAVFEDEEAEGIRLSVILNPTEKTAEIRAIDTAFDEQYTLFDVHDGNAFAERLRNRAEELMERIKDACFVPVSVKLRLFTALEERYGTVPDHPFDGDGDTAVLRTPSRKWYGIVMNIAYRRLGVPSDERVDVLNIKLPEEKIRSLIDSKYFFTCYHMNKKLWISVALIGTLDFDLLLSLVDESYRLVSEKDAGKGRKRRCGG